MAEPRGLGSAGLSSFEEATHLLDDYFQERDPSCEATVPLTRGQTNVYLCSVVSDSARPHELQPTLLLCPQDFPGKKTGVGRPSLLQGIIPTNGLN